MVFSQLAIVGNFVDHSEKMQGGRDIPEPSLISENCVRMGHFISKRKLLLNRVESLIEGLKL